MGNSLSSAELSCFIYGLAKPADQGSVSLKSRRTFGPEKPFVKLQPAYSEEMIFSGVVKGIKIKITAKFLASRCLRCEDTKRIMSPEMGLKCFGTFETKSWKAASTFFGAVAINRDVCQFQLIATDTIVFFSKYSFQWLLLERGCVAWDLFVESPETFRAHFGWHNSLCIFKTRACWGTKLCSYCYFYSLYDIWKDQLYRISRPEFYEWLFGTFEKRALGV